MKKVLQILYSGLGGHGSVALSLAQAARARHTWDNSLLFVGIEPLLPDYAQACKSANAQVGYVHTHPGRSWTAWPAIYQKLAQVRPDAIILHSVKTILPCALYARLHRIPLLAVEHQNNGLKRRSEWWVSRLLMAFADAVVLLTADYRDQSKARLGHAWKDGKAHVISNGIDTDAFAPRPDTGTARPCVIGMAARMAANKRQDLLIDAVQALCERDGPNAWRLTLAGDGETLPALREQVRALALDDVVKFTGYLGESELRQWFSSIDVYAHATAGETLSTSLLQAMAMGLPIVGSDVSGVSNLLAAGGGVGLLAEQTPESFATAFRQLSTEPALANGLRERARAMALSEYSQATMFARYDALLEQLCAA